MSLIFSPTLDAVARELDENENVCLLIAPFINEAALTKLFEKTRYLPRNIKVVTRWKASDLALGVSDPNIYTLLEKQNIPLYINNALHMKLFVTDLNRAYVGSANITKSGLGLKENYNLEAGCITGITTDDWTQVYELINTSTRVTDPMFEVALEYSKENKTKQKLPPLKMPIPEKQEFLISQLPASESPEKLCEHYTIPYQIAEKNEITLEVSHDLCLFDIPKNLSHEEFMDTLKDSFKSNPFIQAIVQQIQDKESISFGALSAWLHNICKDVPTPYRSEIKQQLNIVLNWLPQMYDEITTDIPGKHSTVTYWNRTQ